MIQTFQPSKQCRSNERHFFHLKDLAMDMNTDKIIEPFTGVWSSMETAPMDRYILGCERTMKHPYIMRWNSKKRRFIADGEFQDETPEKWMELPNEFTTVWADADTASAWMPIQEYKKDESNLHLIGLDAKRNRPYSLAWNSVYQEFRRNYGSDAKPDCWFWMPKRPEEFSLNKSSFVYK